MGDVVGTGSSRKSATNSILWYMGPSLTARPWNNNDRSYILMVVRVIAARMVKKNGSSKNIIDSTSDSRNSSNNDGCSCKS